MKFKEFKTDLKANAKFNIVNNSDDFNIRSYLPFERKNQKNYFRYALVSLALLFLVGMGGFMYLNLNPVSYLEMEVNPGVEIQLNRFNRVVGVTATDSNANDIEAELNLKYKRLDDALVLIYDYYIDEGLTVEDNLYVLYGIDASLSNRETINTVINENLPNNVKPIVLVGNFSDVNFSSGEEIASPMTPDGSIDYNNDIGQGEQVPNIVEGRSYEEIIIDYDISDLRLSLVIMLFNEMDDFTTEADFISLLEMNISELYELYEK
ncbi:MAG: hypothetical protein CVV60_05960 [Tenericutes bacterium HGW-Tenericutes-5]|jgi:hypothetical protein|nr:MAG: hypothetical protein CVV60_05960 [Tenericutes bacterium HGW-Tenericutes-5]